MLPTATDERVTYDKLQTTLREGSMQEALSILRKFIDSEPQGITKSASRVVEATAKQCSPEKTEHSFTISELAEKPEAEAFLNLGLRFQNRHNYKAALSLYSQALQRAASDYEVYKRMGDCYLAMGNDNQALDCYRAAVRVRPNSAHGVARLAVIHLNHGEFNDAQEILKLALLENPNLPEIHLALGAIQKFLGNYERAIAHFRQAVLMDKINARSYNELGECFYAIGLFKQAEPYFVKAVKINGHDLISLQNLGTLYYQVGKFSQAASELQKWFTECSRLNKTGENTCAWEKHHVPILNLLAKSYAKCRQLAKAEEIWQLSLKIDEEQVDAIRGVAGKKSYRGKIR